MVDLDKHYKDLDAKEYVEILESKEKYKKLVLDYCENRLLELNTPKEDLKDYSRAILNKRFYGYFAESKHWYNKEIDLDSFFLTKTEAKQCFKFSKAQFIYNRNNATRNLPSG